MRCDESYGGYGREHADERRRASDGEQPEEHPVGQLGDPVPLLRPFGVLLPDRRPVVDGVRRPRPSLPSTAGKRVALRHVRQVVYLNVLPDGTVGHVVVVAVKHPTPELLPTSARSKQGSPNPGRHAMARVLAQVDVCDNDGHEEGDRYHDHRRAEQHAYNNM